MDNFIFRSYFLEHYVDNFVDIMWKISLLYSWGKRNCVFSNLLSSLHRGLSTLSCSSCHSVFSSAGTKKPADSFSAAAGSLPSFLSSNFQFFPYANNASRFRAASGRRYVCFLLIFVSTPHRKRTRRPDACELSGAGRPAGSQSTPGTHSLPWQAI